MADVDVIVVGGGVAGAAVATNLARRGRRVVVMEREKAFRDRVRGELMYAWGAEEVRRLGLMPTLGDVSLELRGWVSRIDPMPLSESRPDEPVAITFPHPVAQSVLLDGAARAGADVRTGVAVRGVTAGAEPVVSYRGGDRRDRKLSADLVVGADGRSSVVARTAGVRTERSPDTLVLAGAVLAGSGAPADIGNMFMHPSRGLLAMTVPLPDGRHRMYAGYHLATGRRNLSGPPAFGDFKDVIWSAGTPREWFDGAELDGPLAEFGGGEVSTGVTVDGVVLVGDAAAVSDPNWGCGLSLAMRDVRELMDALDATDDPSSATETYAARHADYHGALRRKTTWLEQMFRTPGAQADALRRRAMPLFAADPSRVPDVVGDGPDGPSDEAARRRFFGED